MKGQGSIEYLIILAMVLIVALIAVVLLGGIPVGMDNPMNAESLAYWANTRPFQLPEWGQINSTLYLTVVNVDTRRLVITSITIGNVTTTLSPGWTFAPGARKSINMTGFQACDEQTYDSYEYNVSFNYSSTDIASSRQFGDKPIIGRCSFS